MSQAGRHLLRSAAWKQVYTQTRAHTHTNKQTEPCRWTGPGMDSQTVPEVRGGTKRKEGKEEKKLLVEGEKVQQEKSYSWSTCMIPARGPQEQETVITVTLVFSKSVLKRDKRNLQVFKRAQKRKHLKAHIIGLSFTKPNIKLFCFLSNFLQRHKMDPSF